MEEGKLIVRLCRVFQFLNVGNEKKVRFQGQFLLENILGRFENKATQIFPIQLE